MFDWILNTPLLNAIIFFLWRFQIKFNDFSNFFSTINFSCQYLPEAEVHLEPSRTFYNGAFLQNIFLLQNSQEKTCAGVSFQTYRSPAT